MTLHCIAGNQFTPGRPYHAREFTFLNHTFIDVTDDAGITQRFCTNPRCGVRNEHPLENAWMVFRRPPEIENAEMDLRTLARSEKNQIEASPIALWRVIQAKGCVRPLIIIPRGRRPNIACWRRDFKRLSVPVWPINSALTYNRRVLIEKLPEGYYLSHLPGLFLEPNGSPLPDLYGRFDFLFIT